MPSRLAESCWVLLTPWPRTLVSQLRRFGLVELTFMQEPSEATTLFRLAW